MKRIILFAFIVLIQNAYTQEKQIIKSPKVNKQVELLSIVFRLAGNKEYNATFVKKYTDKVESHFSAYKEHELIKFARSLRENNGVSYDAVVSLAVVLDDNLNPIIDFSKNLQDKRWSKDDANKFLKLLKRFYKDADCEKFFKENAELFQDVSDRFDSVFKTLDLNWFQSFYGLNTNENFNIIVSLGCGGNNYGPSYTLNNAKKEVFAIMGTWKVDELGMPIYEKNEYLPTIIHEFNHSFINPLLAKNEELFEKNGKEIYNAVEYEMNQQNYKNWQIMLNEGLVRASVIKYYIDHGADETEIQIMENNESNKGFIWIKGLVDEITKYDNQRNIFPTLESYIPELSKAYESFAKKISQYDAQRPKVESIAEFTNNDTNVNPKIKTITINFDKPLAGQGYSINYGSKGQSAFPKLDNIHYINKNKSVVMEVHLIPGKEYQFVLTGKNFKTNQGFPLKTYEVIFKTH